MGAGELILYVSVLLGIAIMLPSMVGMQHQAFSDQVAQVEAGQLATITDAALQYEYGYLASLSTPGSTHTVTVATLVSQGYLPPGTKTTDAMGDPISIEYQADSSGNVTGYVVAQGNYRYPDPDAGEILLDLGDRGGYVPDVPIAGQVAGTIYGTGNTWQSPAPAGIGPGSIAVKVESNAAQQADDSRFLWRVPAPTAAGNTMSTPLILGAVETPGAACANTGALAQDGTGALVSCQSGTWTAVGGGHWRAPVSTFAALPSSGNQNGDVRLTLDTDRAFAWNGGSWAALAVNQNGNLHVPGHLYAENGGVSTSTSCSGQGSLSAGDITLTTDNGCATGGSAIQMQNPITGQGYAIVDSADGSLDFWNTRTNYSAMQIQSDGTIESQAGGSRNWVIDGAGNTNPIAGDPNGWGFQPEYYNGWSMVTQDGAGNLNVAPGSALGSANVNDIDVRSGGAYPWYSQLSNQVYSDTQQLSQQGNQINNLNNEYSSQQGQINNNTSSIGTINNNLNQGPCSTGYNSIATLCNEIQSFGVANMGKLLTTGTQGPVTYSYWGYCGSRFYRYRCIQYGTSPPTVNLTASSAPELVFADASAGIGQGGCGSSANTGQVTLSATSGGAPVASQSGRYGKGGSNYNPNAMYFPFSLMFTLPAGQSGQIQLSGGENGLGCGSIQYAVYQL
jgi:hypothetical protein